MMRLSESKENSFFLPNESIFANLFAKIMIIFEKLFVSNKFVFVWD